MSGALLSSEMPSKLKGGFDALFSAIEQVEAQVNAVPHASFQGHFQIPSSRPTTPPPVTYNKRPASESPQKPPPKRVGGRGRGRGRGSGHGAKSSGTAPHSKPSIVGMKTSRVDDPPNNDIFTSGRWNAAEQTALFTHIFGSDSDHIHAKWLKNKDCVYTKYLQANHSVAERFTVKSVASKITSSITMYGYMREYEEFTGGGGDADLQSMVPESDEWHKQRLILAKRGGKSIGSLTVKKYHEWKDNGWYDIFEERSSKVDRPMVRNSVAPISPIRKNDDDIDNIHWPPTPERKSPTESIHSDSEGEASIVLQTPKAGASCSTSVSQVVSEPHYQAPATTKSSAKKKSSLASADAFGAINTFFDSKARLTEVQLRRSMTESANSVQGQRLQELRNILDSNIDELTREVVNEKICKIISEY
ncbi:hypothetical protein DFJ43DRAFT_1190242 [Lentinula guzmanii]|uniref:Uncharacterized protein n=1 Tax=Lentinula guzmanii TaxID=2804957 RepID=A0AA38J7W5_9AGAR|nr:hypothetical protein DFJ43DRAFT_1190242 [Lentinula guzmanii]